MGIYVAKYITISHMLTWINTGLITNYTVSVHITLSAYLHLIIQLGTHYNLYLKFLKYLYN